MFFAITVSLARHVGLGKFCSIVYLFFFLYSDACIHFLIPFIDSICFYRVWQCNAECNNTKELMTI